MWTRVRLFFHKYFQGTCSWCIQANAARDAANAAQEGCLALAAKLTYMQARHRITESAVCSLDNAVTKIITDQYPNLAKVDAERAAERVRKGIKARGVMPVLPSLAGDRALTGVRGSSGYEYEIGPSPDDDPLAPDCEVKE